MSSGAVELCRTLDPDVLVVDVDGDEDAADTIVRLRGDAVGTPIVVLSGSHRRRHACWPRSGSGCAGFVGKNDGLRIGGPRSAASPTVSG